MSRREERAAKSERRVSSAPARSTEDDESDSKASNGTPGLLRINSRPWSQVFIDGKLIGNTPQFGISLPAGKHSVRLVNAEFGMSKVFTLKLGAGESVTRVEMLSE
ncbi:MAG TPA: PEGA domain-containing protein [Polyangiales bacterium]|nr:PEGA domain-containing protein [Polyangiales bacterium]